MKTVILCGGYGTRIRDVAEDIPKPMIPIGEYPILWHIMKYYSRFDHKDFVLCLGYKGSSIKDFFINYDFLTRDFTITLGNRETHAQKVTYYNDHSENDWNVTLADTGLNVMTGARVRKIKKYIGNDDTFMLTYGDGVGNVDLKKLLEFHKSHGKIMTVTGVKPPGRFGEIKTDSKGIVTEFNEKPQATGGKISGGFFVCNKKIFDYLEERDDLVFEQEPINRLVKESQLAVYEHDGFWMPMDTSREYNLLNSLYKKGEAPWVIW
jgi:glucose-1-phosphate cytidylyltransferase